MTVKQFKVEVKQFEYRCWCYTLILFVTATVGAVSMDVRACCWAVTSIITVYMKTKDTRNTLWMFSNVTVTGAGDQYHGEVQYMM